MKKLIYSIILAVLFSVLPSQALAADVPTTALDFTATPSANVAIPASPFDYDLTRYQEFTWSAWLRLKQEPTTSLPFIFQEGSQYMSIMGDPSNSEYKEVAVELEHEDQDPSNGHYATEYWERPTRLQVGQWYFVTYSFDHGVGRWYVNNNLVTTHVIYPWYPPLAPWYNQNPLSIGNIQGHLDQHFPGYIAKVRFYLKRLSQAEITKLYNGYNVTSYLVGTWNLDEGSGSIAHDTSGKGNNGTVSGATWATGL